MGLAFANRIASGQDLLDRLERRFEDINKHLEATSERLKLPYSEKPRSAVPSLDSKQPEKDEQAKNQRRANLAKNLSIERNVDALIQSVQDTERTIDVFLPVFSIEMIDSAAKLYEQLAQIEKPYRALKRAFLDPNDGGSVVEASLAAVNARELVATVKQFCDLVKVDMNKLENEFQPFTDEAHQRAGIDEFLYLHFEGSLKQQRLEMGLSK
jgi:hypothetical protein